MTREEAIEVYNGLINTKIKEAFEFFAPELAGSKDERIRKDIVSHFESIKAQALYDRQEESDSIVSSCNEKIAWLEKLKERGPLTKEEEYTLHRIIEYLEDETCPSEWISLLQDIYCLPYGKQKEHSMSAEEVLARAGLKPYKDGNKWCILAGNNIQEGICGFGDTIDEALYQFLMDVLEEQKEQKEPHYTKRNALFDKCMENCDPAVMKEVSDEVDKMLEKEQKPAEWSEDWREEDIQTRFAFYTYKDKDGVLYLSNVFVEEASRNHGFGTRILRAAEKVAETIGATTVSLKVKQDSPANAWYRKNGYGYVAYEDGYDWLEKNLEYMKPNKQEWSEEDEHRRTDVIYFLESAKTHYADTIETEKLIAWLKSLRPSWKPSEEQMDRLFSIVAALRKDYCDDMADFLANLRADLKKLGVKEEPEYYQHFDPNC